MLLYLFVGADNELVRPLSLVDLENDRLMSFEIVSHDHAGCADLHIPMGIVNSVSIVS